MGMEEDIKNIKSMSDSILIQQTAIEIKLNDINEKIDLLTIRKRMLR